MLASLEHQKGSNVHKLAAPRFPQSIAIDKMDLNERLKLLKQEGKDLASLHREAWSRAARHLPNLGSLQEAEEDMTEALTLLKSVSPLLLLDGTSGAGKSSLAETLLWGVQAQPLAGIEQAAATARRLGFPLIIRSPPSAASANSIADCAEQVRAFNSYSTAATTQSVDLANDSLESLEAQGSSPHVPAVLEDSRASRAWGSDLWLTELDCEEDISQQSQWVQSCADVICVVRASSEGLLGPASVKRVMSHLEQGRRLLVIANITVATEDASEEDLSKLDLKALGERVRQQLSSNQEEIQVYATCLFQVLRATSCGQSNCERVGDTGCDGEGSKKDEDAAYRYVPGQEVLAEAIRVFAEVTANMKNETSDGHLTDSRDAFVRWCSKGAKIVKAASIQFQVDAEDVRSARDLIKENIDAAYLEHVFSSVLVGKFSALCGRLAKAHPPEMGDAWGRNATRQIMEQSLNRQLEEGLRIAMQESLGEVTMEMARQEQPSVERIQRVARRCTSVPWDADVRRLEVDLDPDHLQHFALQFFGSLSVGVLSGIGAIALETLIGELALGPVGVIAGVATFVAIGVQTADWRSVRNSFVKKAQSRNIEMVEKARKQLDFPGLCERRKRTILELMDVVLERLTNETAMLAEAGGEFADCALSLQETTHRRH